MRLSRGPDWARYGMGAWVRQGLVRQRPRPPPPPARPPPPPARPPPPPPKLARPAEERLTAPRLLAARSTWGLLALKAPLAAGAERVSERCGLAAAPSGLEGRWALLSATAGRLAA